VPYRRKKFTSAISSPDEFLSVLTWSVIADLFRSDCDCFLVLLAYFCLINFYVNITVVSSINR